ERECRLPAVGRDLQRPAFEAFRPEVERFDGLEPEMFGVPARGFVAVGHADVHVVESSHAEGVLLLHAPTLDPTTRARLQVDWLPSVSSTVCSAPLRTNTTFTVSPGLLVSVSAWSCSTFVTD